MAYNRIGVTRILCSVAWIAVGFIFISVQNPAIREVATSLVIRSIYTLPKGKIPGGVPTTSVVMSPVTTSSEPPTFLGKTAESTTTKHRHHKHHNSVHTHNTHHRHHHTTTQAIQDASTTITPTIGQADTQPTTVCRGPSSRLTKVCESSSSKSWRKDKLWSRIQDLIQALRPFKSTSCYVLVTLLDVNYKRRWKDLLTRPYYRSLVVLAMDQKTHDYFVGKGTWTLLVPEGDTAGRIMRAKTEVTLALLESDWTVIFFEADVFCKSDPAALLANRKLFPADDSKDFAISAHADGRADTPELNIGFFIAKPTPAVHNIFCLLANWWHKPNRAPNCCGPTEDQCTFDYAIRRAKEKGARYGHSRIGGDMLIDTWYNSCRNWRDQKDLMNSQSENYTGWVRIPIDIVANWFAPPKAVCAHVFIIGGAEARIAGVETWYGKMKRRLLGHYAWHRMDEPLPQDLSTWLQS